MIFLIGLTAQAGLGAEPGVTVVSYKDQKVTLTTEVVGKLPRIEVQAAGKDGVKHTFSGVKVTDLLALVGAPLGEALKKDALVLVVRIRGAAGFTVAFSLAEFDPRFSDRTILLADRQDGAPLPANEGLYRVIIPEDKWQSRWVRQVVAIEAD